MRPAHIVRVGGGDFAIPVVGKAERLELAAKVLDVRGGGHGRMLAGLDRVLLGGQPERIVAHRVQHIEAVHPLVAADDVGGGVALRVADMESRAARVGKHVEHIVFRLGRIKALVAGAGGAESFFRIPTGLPFGFEVAERVRLAVV